MLDKINGMSLKRYCEERGICYRTVLYRLKHGVPLEEAIIPKAHYPKGIREKYGEIVYKRVQLGGYTLEEALSPDFYDIADKRHFEKTGETRSFNKRKYMIGDERLCDVCRKKGLSYNLVFYWIRKKGKTPEEAVEIVEERKNDRRREERSSGDVSERVRRFQFDKGNLGTN